MLWSGLTAQLVAAFACVVVYHGAYDVLIVVWQRPNADVDNDAGSLIHDDCLPHSHGTYRCDIYTIYDAIRYDAMRCDAITI